MGGGTVGYNWQLGRSPYVVGIEGELGHLVTKGSSHRSVALVETSGMTLRMKLRLVVRMAMV